MKIIRVQNLTDDLDRNISDIQIELGQMPMYEYICGLPQKVRALVIMDMSTKWAMNRDNWDNPGQFLLNYADRVYDLTDPHVHKPDMSDVPGQTAHVTEVSIHQAKWDEWGRTLVKFACVPDPSDVDF